MVQRGRQESTGLCESEAFSDSGGNEASPDADRRRAGSHGSKYQFTDEKGNVVEIPTFKIQRIGIGGVTFTPAGC